MSKSRMKYHCTSWCTGRVLNPFIDTGRNRYKPNFSGIPVGGLLIVSYARWQAMYGTGWTLKDIPDSSRRVARRLRSFRQNIKRPSIPADLADLVDNLQPSYPAAQF